ncbi:MAG: hypothetical protein GXP32_05495, partial [Kiritimatiellaeota bacterium]|nr:hypothetical protein [Kiritimatiellota bacterium]
MSRIKKTYPVNLLLDGERCLVVGGGKVATRKTLGLLGSGCDIAVCALKVSEKITSLVSEGEVSLIERPFDASMLDGNTLVFAATDDKALNSRIIELCRERGIQCCAVDSNWTSGSFITPASFEKNGVAVAVSTQGESCRKTRMIKNSLERHITMLERAEFIVMGTDHNYLNLVDREKLHLIGEKLVRTGDLVVCVWGVHEFMLLNTCNRIELMAIASPSENVETLLEKIIGFDSLNNDAFYLKRGFEAFAHSGTVMAGLMSQTPGEKHITAQVKEMHAIAEARGWAGSMIREWMDCSLHISKHIRRETEPLLLNYEIEDLSLNYI